ncbi:glutamate/aspartate transport system permease protein [Formivibrio citricus]|uniref:Glutamate/aspartate transport system permease protein n=1 Tax=Formivibrio citricus TaxID=83765 RepID=A0A1I4XUB8_9NEIS|nr:amino acid ABC transporter permease [Formivibrio citricus]SFN29488.1 glutamate/aspartate transport system permease protein [Formivibrio citricus]
MNYNWDWAVFFKSTGIGEEIYLHWFMSGLLWTLALSLCGWLIALLLGSLLGTMRTLPNRWLAGIGSAYVSLFRNVPLLVQLFVWYFLIPDILPESMQTWLKQDLSPEVSGFLIVTLCLGLFTAARVCEQVRTGIEALPRGQRQAAAALGLTTAQTYRRVLLPQAFRIVIPPLTSEFLNIIKNSSVASLVGLMELLAQTKQTGEFTANLFEAFTMATLIYFTVNMGVMFTMSRLERKLRVPGLIALGGK